MRRGSALLALLLLLTGRADATLYFATSFEACFPQTEPTPVDFNYWKAQPTPTSGALPRMPLVTTLNAMTLPGGTDRCSLRFTPSSGLDSYRLLDQGISGGKTSLRATFSLYVRDPGPIGTSCDILAFGNGTTDGAVLTMTSNGSSVAPTLSVVVNDATTKRCTGATNNDKACTTTADCTSINPAETVCTVLSAASATPPLNAWRLVTLTQDNGSGSTAGQITAGLYEGATGATPTSYSRASDAITVGFCAGGSAINEPCNVNGDCPSSTCTTTNVPSITQVRLGKTGTGTCAGDWQLGFLTYYDGTVTPNLYMEALDGSGIATADANTNWTTVGTAHSCGASGSQYQCLKDTSAPDGNSSALENNNSAKPTIAVQFGNPATPATSPTPLAVVLEMVAQDTAAGANGITVDLEQNDGSSSSTVYTPFAFDGFAEAGGTTDPYYLMPPSLWAQSWTLTKLNALEGRINKTAGGGDNGRLSTLIAEVLWQTTDPPVPAIIPDRDQDGRDTVCFAGDSTWHNSNTTFVSEVVGGLIEPTDLYFYTRGGSKLGDTLAQITSLIEGTSGGFLPLDVRRGASGRTCDVLLVEHLANALTAADPNWGANFRGLSQSGYCQDDGGADQGNPCWCDGKTDDWTSHFGATPAPQITPANRYCVNRGDFAQPGQNRASGIPQIDCRCTTASDCQVGGDGVTATCTGGLCVGNALGTCTANASANVRTTFVASGCLNTAGCPSGVCVQGRTPQAIEQGLADLKAAIDIRPTPAPTPPVGGKPIVVYASAPEGVGLACWMWTRASASAYRGVVIPFAKTRGLPFIDTWARFHRECNLYQFNCPDPCPYERACYRDDVHWNQRGQLVAAQAVVECLTNALPGEAAGTRTHDGTCSAGVCTTGLIGDGCSTGADCDTWSCDFAAAP